MRSSLKSNANEAPSNLVADKEEAGPAGTRGDREEHQPSFIIDISPEKALQEATAGRIAAEIEVKRLQDAAKTLEESLLFVESERETAVCAIGALNRQMEDTEERASKASKERDELQRRAEAAETQAMQLEWQIQATQAQLQVLREENQNLARQKAECQQERDRERAEMRLYKVFYERHKALLREMEEAQKGVSGVTEPEAEKKNTVAYSAVPDYW